MTEMTQVRALIEETVIAYLSPKSQVTQIEQAPMGEDEQGWSGAEIRRYKASLRQIAPITLITKAMPLKERRVLHCLSQQGHANVPFAFTKDLTTYAPILTCMQDVDGW